MLQAERFSGGRFTQTCTHQALSLLLVVGSKTRLVFLMYYGTHFHQGCRPQTEYARSVLLSKAHLRWLICIFIILQQRFQDTLDHLVLCIRIIWCTFTLLTIFLYRLHNLVAAHTLASCHHTNSKVCI